MKIKLLLPLFIGLMLTSIAEEYAFNYCRLSSVKKVFNIGNVVAHLSYSESGPDGDYYVVWGNKMGEPNANKAVFLVPENFRFKELKNEENAALIVFENTSNQTLAFFEINKEIQITKQKIQSTGNTGVLRTFNTDNLIWQNGKLYLSRQYQKYATEKAKKVVEFGVEICQFSMDYELVWAHKIMAEGDCSPSIEDIVVQNEACKASVSYSCNRGKDFNLKIHSLSSDGKQTGLLALENNEGTLYPTVMKPIGNEMVVSGMYFNEPWMKAKSSDGLFFLRMNAQGELLSKTLKPWLDIIEQIKEGTKNDFLFSGEMQVLIQDIWATDKGYAILGESFVKSSGTTAGDVLIGDGAKKGVRALTIFDFVMFNFDKKGVFVDLAKCEKDKRNVLIQGRDAYKHSVQLSKIVRDNELFSYRSYENGNITYFNLIDRLPYILQANFTTGEITKKTALKFGPDPVEKENPQYESKLLQGLSDFQQGYDDFAKQLSQSSDNFNYGIARADQVFIPNALSVSGLLEFAPNRYYSFILHPDLETVYIRTIE